MLSFMPSDPALTARWSTAAPYWDQHRAIIREMFAPVTQALVDDAQVRHSAAVLDVATGPGEPALSIAALVGPEGKVAGIDHAPEMVASARRAAEAQGYTNARFEVASADRLPFDAATFDAVVSRFGAMFFPSPVGAVGEMLRVLKPGGKLALAVWRSAEDNPFFHVLQQAVDRYFDSTPDVQDTFRFSDFGKLRDILGEAGALAPAERLLSFTIHARVSAEEFWTMRCQMSQTLREKVAMLSPDRLAEARRDALAALHAYSNGSGLDLPAQVLIVSGARPA
jgi:ubiquinone/menaquinone biosynthesis C-methylase UbiE